MSLAHSSSVVQNGLVFYYDMGNTQKSWKGKPTSNLVNSSWSAWGIDGSGQGSIGTRTIISTNYCRIIDIASNTRQQIIINGILPNTTYTASVKYKKLAGTPTLRFQIQAWTSSAAAYISTMAFPTTAQVGISNVDDWQIAYYTVTTPANTGSIVWFMQDGDDYTTYTHGFELKEPQLELGSIPSTFIDGTRSNTQAIIDLTGNNTITTNSLTYSANGEFSFNGSSDFLNCGKNTSLDSISGTTNVTVESWVNLSGYGSSGYGVITHKGNPWAWLMENPSQTMRIRFSLSVSGDIACSDTLPHDLNVWYHFVGTYDGSNMRFYRNGNLTNTVSASGTLGGSGVDMVVGSFSGAYFSSGKIPVVKIYNRTLSATEIKQNFDALRDRYGI